MLNIMVVCGNGLGSSFLMEMNINKVLKEIGAEVKVDHCDLTSAKGYKSDIIVALKDIAGQLEGLSEVLVSLDNLLDMDDMKAKIVDALAHFEK